MHPPRNISKILTVILALAFIASLFINPFSAPKASYFTDKEAYETIDRKSKEDTEEKPVEESSGNFTMMSLNIIYYLFNKYKLSQGYEK